MIIPSPFSIAFILDPSPKAALLLLAAIFSLVAALVPIMAVLYNMGSYYCLGADLEWIDQLSKRSLPALNLGSSNSDNQVAISKSIAICTTLVTHTRDQLGLKFLQHPFHIYSRVSKARVQVAELKVLVWNLQNNLIVGHLSGGNTTQQPSTTPQHNAPQNDTVLQATQTLRRKRNRPKDTSADLELGHSHHEDEAGPSNLQRKAGAGGEGTVGPCGDNTSSSEPESGK